MARKTWIDFAAVRDALSFHDVLTHYEIDHPTGTAQVKIHCPFHDDRTPSCSINLTGKKFNCFGCDAQGNLLDFIILMEGGDTDDHTARYAAAETAVGIMGRDLKEFGRASAPKSKTKAKVKAAPKSAPPADDTPAPPIANPLFEKELKLQFDHPFLAARDVTPEQAERFELGYCKAGLMRGRIAIRLHNRDGEALGYVGRYASEDIPDGTERYLFPKDFHKSLELWNLHRALTLEKRFLVVVEGYWSTIRLHDLGIPTAALMGSSVSPEQAELIRTVGIRHALLLLDGDDPGRKAAPAAAHVLSQHVYVRTLVLPEGEKPDSVPAKFLEPFL
ncbi:CHC2 zinc finger domain-containing protein [uncultured Tateyamaria sp.]|uniref:CHC2 zinc finger domain-containing protein n=1 Tax=uncultured Tateyamaria sp. TaxID=455651 RepID=UPI0026302E1E|nr:CHC2 zinc finger domain-containing protein [uncultured Tateyamaria sp.]